MHIRKLPIIGAVLLSLIVFSVPAAEAAYVESINGSAIPATPETSVFYDQFDNAGWYYTPAIDYTLTGIYSNFGPRPGFSGTNMITVQIQSERPTNGGMVLAEATFEGDRAVGGLLGGSFAPLSLTAGQTYFVDYLHVSGMGVNLGTWEYDGSFVPQPAGGATTNLGVYYRDDDNGFGTDVTNVWEVAGDFVTHVSGAEPILYFEGYVVPEPAAGLLLAVGGGLLAARRRRGAGGRT